MEVYTERFIENGSIAYNIYKCSDDVKLSIAIIEDYLFDTWLEEIREKPKSIWDLKKGDTYYYLDLNCSYSKVSPFMIFTEDDFLSYKSDLENGNIFLTEEEAEKELEKRRAIQRIKKYCWENEIELADKDFLKNPENDRCEISYDVESKEISVFNYKFYNYMNIELLFRSHHEARIVVDNCKDDLEIIFDV